MSRKTSPKVENLLYFGSVLTPSECSENQYCSEAGNTFQLRLLSGLIRQGMHSITAVSYYPMASYPKGKCLVNRRRTLQLSRSIEFVYPPFLNKGIIKMLTFILASLFELCYLALRNTKKFDAILIYNSVFHWALPALIFARLLQIPTVLVVADFDPFLTTPLLRHPVRKVQSYVEMHLARRFDATVVLSGNSARFLQDNQPHLKLDGAIDANEFAIADRPGPLPRDVIMYAGKLDELSGVGLLLEAFALLERDNNDWELWITGRGVLEQRIKDLCIQNKNIKYFGFVSRTRYIELIRKATILVNPRRSSFESNKYNFPSKLLEYMATGKPVITTDTSGIKQEYGDKVFILIRETPEALANVVRRIQKMDKEELTNVTSRARKYVLEQKNWEIQANRMYNFLNAVVRGR